MEFGAILMPLVWLILGGALGFLYALSRNGNEPDAKHGTRVDPANIEHDPHRNREDDR